MSEVYDYIKANATEVWPLSPDNISTQLDLPMIPIEQECQRLIACGRIQEVDSRLWFDSYTERFYVATERRE